jgi:hypothetical protein
LEVPQTSNPVTHTELAATFEAYLHHDLTIAATRQRPNPTTTPATRDAEALLTVLSPAAQTPVST